MSCKAKAEFLADRQREACVLVGSMLDNFFCPLPSFHNALAHESRGGHDAKNGRQKCAPEQKEQPIVNELRTNANGRTNSAAAARVKRLSNFPPTDRKGSRVR